MLIIISLSCLSCVAAQELNTTDDELQLDTQDVQVLEAAVSEDVNESSIQDTPELLSKSKSAKAEESKSNLIIDNDADKEDIYIGDYVTWTVSVINKGPDTAKNVKVLDQLPKGLKYIRHTLTKGKFNPDSGQWTIGNLSVDDGEVFLYIVTKAVSVGEKINKAKVFTDSVNLNANESYEEEEIDVLEKSSKIAEKAAYAKIHPTGNPVYLIFISLFGVLIASFKARKN